MITIVAPGGGDFRYAFQSRVPRQFLYQRAGDCAASKVAGARRYPTLSFHALTIRTKTSRAADPSVEQMWGYHLMENSHGHERVAQ
jgi:hypothetical protein